MPCLLMPRTPFLWPEESWVGNRELGAGKEVRKIPLVSCEHLTYLCVWVSGADEG